MRVARFACFVLLSALFLVSCGSALDPAGDSSTGDLVETPVLDSVSIDPGSAPAGSTVVIAITFSFTDDGENVGGGRLLFDYPGNSKTITVPSSASDASGTVTVSCEITLDETVGNVTVPVTLTDTLNNTSDAVNVVLNQIRPWTVQLGTSANDISYATAVDSSGNIYICGETSGDLGSANAGGSDLFIAKYNPSGAQEWLRQFGNASSQVAQGIAVFGSNIYITGYTIGSLDGQANAGNADVFLIKYDSNGNRIWTRLLGGTANDYGNDVAVDASGDIYVTGHTTGDLPGNSSSGGIDAFAAKFDSTGARLWVYQLGSAGTDYGNKIAVSGGFAYVIGHGTLPGYTADGRAYLAKFNAATGDLVDYATSMFAPSGYGSGLAVDSQGYLYASGYTDGQGAFLTKYDSSLSYIWGVKLGGSGTGNENVAVDASDNIYLTGFTTANLSGYPNSGLKDGWVAKYNGSGTLLWTRLFGTGWDDWANGIAIYGTNIYVSGYTEGDLDGNSNAGGRDIFIVKFNPDGVRQ